MKKNLNKIVLVATIAFIVATISILHVLVGFAKTPKGYEYLWTGHYFLDYFVYLQTIVQGMRGHWLVDNPFATDDPTKTFLVWGPYIIIGKIASLFHISAITAYWMSVFLLTFLIVVATYILISKLLSDQSFKVKVGALFFSLFATPFVLITKTPLGISVTPYDFWYAPSNIFKRFEFVPHHLLGNLLILILLILISGLLDNLSHFKYKQVIKKALIVGLIVIFSLSFYPYNTISLFLAAGACGLIYLLDVVRKKIIASGAKIMILMGLLSLMIVPAAFVIKNISKHSAVIERLGQQDVLYRYFPDIFVVLLSFGPLLIISLLGIKTFSKNFSYSKLLLIIFISISCIFSLTKLSYYFGNFNLRFQTPIAYVLLGSLGVLGILKLKKFALIMFLLLTIYFGYVNFLSFRSILVDKNIFSPISYVSGEIIQGFKLLEKLPKKGNVLVPPSQIFGAIVPIYTDRKTYVVRPAFTPDYVVRNITASNFYLGAMTGNEAQDFLKDNKIEYVLLTGIEGYNSQVLYNYSFLKEVYKSSSIVVFKII